VAQSSPRGCGRRPPRQPGAGLAPSDPITMKRTPGRPRRALDEAHTRRTCSSSSRGLDQSVLTLAMIGSNRAVSTVQRPRTNEG
jgi:hypothetical protein